MYAHQEGKHQTCVDHKTFKSEELDKNTKDVDPYYSPSNIWVGPFLL